MRPFLACSLVIALCAPATPASADAVVLLAEPYGRGGGFNPTGHVGIYLTRVCAETPTTLRRCKEGETGAVISRYNKLGAVDWVAIPLIPYLYAVERASDVPVSVSPVTVRSLRERYRRESLLGVVPDAAAPDTRHWPQLVGGAYDRQFVAVSVRTTPEQDDHLIADLNSRDNERRFNALLRNCADFARDVINDYYYPRALGSSVIADLGVTTPKQIAKGLARYGSRNPETSLSVYVIPQIPGNRPSSRSARGILESFVRTKRYALPLIVVQPWVPVGLAAGYLTSGRFNPHRLSAGPVQPEGVERQAMLAAVDTGLVAP